MLGKKKIIAPKIIKQAIDNLPTGICYFNQRQLVLCNKQMDKLAYALLGRDLQYEGELAEALEKLEDNKFVMADGSVWYFNIKRELDLDGEKFSFYMASDVTEIEEKSKELRQKNHELSQMIPHLEEINKNVVAIAREEEILFLKMQVHSGMGKSVLYTHKYYEAGCPPQRKAELIEYLKDTLSTLQGEVGKDDDTDMLGELMNTAKAIGTKIIIDGQLPKKFQPRKIIIVAMREALTNAIRHGKGDTLFVKIWEGEREFTAEMTNNGQLCPVQIIEGGGLGSLRVSVENAGGAMEIETRPSFKLIIKVKKSEEE